MKPKLKTIKKIVDYLNDLAAINDGNPSTEDIKRLMKQHRVTAIYHAEISHLGLATYTGRKLKMNKLVYHPIDARKILESMYNRYPKLGYNSRTRNKAKAPVSIPNAPIKKEEVRLMPEVKSKTKWVSADELKQMAEKLQESDNIQTKQRIAKLENQPRKKVSILWGLIKWEI